MMLKKLSLGARLALGYLVLIMALYAWMKLKSGDTPIIPALALIWPWGFMPSRIISTYASPTLEIANALSNAILLYIAGSLIGLIVSQISKWKTTPRN